VLAGLHERARHGAAVYALLLPHVHAVSNAHAKHVPAATARRTRHERER
jgi:hypothetical protein